MKTEHRNRAQGWKHAKLSGHKNEELVRNLLDRDERYAADFLDRLGDAGPITATTVGGLHETNVESILGGRKTKSRTDLKIFLKNGENINISIKKSLGGQVYFVRAGLFIATFQKQFGQEIPAPVQRAIKLFWAAADDASDIIRRYAAKDKNYDLQIRHRSLNADTLRAYDPDLYEDLLLWFQKNAGKIAMLCFAMGAVKSQAEWSDFIWYINLLDENDVDALFSIEELCAATQQFAQRDTFYGLTNGGTTIQLPFGFVQWHQSQMQFHHSYDKISNMLG